MTGRHDDKKLRRRLTVPYIYLLPSQARNISTLAETAIYVATVDKYSDVLRAILAWVAENKDEVGDIKMDNADCILHAALEDDKEQV